MKRIFCILLAMLTLLSVASAEEWYSVADICEQTPARWTQTYETKWRTITIDAAIELPQVEDFPILKVRKMPVVDESLLPADADVRYNDPGRFQYYTGDAEYVIKNNTMFKSIDYYPGPELPDVLAEDCSFIPQDALELAHTQLLRLYGLDESHFRLDETLVYSRIWHRITQILIQCLRDFLYLRTERTENSRQKRQFRVKSRSLPFEYGDMAGLGLLPAGLFHFPGRKLSGIDFCSRQKCTHYGRLY